MYLRFPIWPLTHLLFEKFILAPDELQVPAPDGCGPETLLGVGVQVQHDLLPPGLLVPGQPGPHVLGVWRRQRLGVDTGKLQEGGEPVSDVDQPGTFVLVIIPEPIIIPVVMNSNQSFTPTTVYSLVFESFTTIGKLQKVRPLSKLIKWNVRI